jgi:3D (Asp-Asp-Asp) domain-containing protein
VTRDTLSLRIAALLAALGMLAGLGTRAAFGREPVRRWCRVSSYCPCRICCGPAARGICADGSPARGKIVAAPKGFPFGTVLDIPGYGRATVRDRGGAISKADRLDVLQKSHALARAWGVRRVRVTVYRKGH